MFSTLNSTRMHHAERWLNFMNELWSEDTEAIEALQEMFGYHLTTDTSQQKIHLLIGPKRSGKGTIARVLRALLGSENIAAPTLASLATNFGLQTLLGKMVATILRCPLVGTDGRGGCHRTAARDLRRGRPDRGSQVPAADDLPTARAVLDSQQRTAQAQRFIRGTGEPHDRPEDGELLVREGRHKAHEPTAHRAAWHPAVGTGRLAAIDGPGHFIQPESGKESIELLEELTSPIATWVKDCCDLGPTYEVLPATLHASWVIWCGEQGNKNPTDSKVFGRDLAAALPALKIKRPRRDGERARFYVGIRLKP